MIKKRLYIVLFTLIISSAFAQNKAVTVNNINFSYVNKNIVITYDIENFSPSNLYNITVSIFRKDGSKLNAVSLSGDITNVVGGKGNSITWNQLNDGYVLDEEIYITLGIATKVNISVSSHLLKSTVFPGWGDYKLRNKKYYFLYSVVGYASIGTSIYFNNLAQQNYTNYTNSFDAAKSNNYFNTAKKQQNLSYIFAGAACMVWTIDIATLYGRVKKVKNNISESKYYYQKQQERTTNNSLSQHINTKQPYDIALERGDKLFEQQKYEEAKIAYEEAIKHNSTPTANNKLSTVNKIIAENNSKQLSYNKALSNANTLFASKKYVEAKMAYEDALSILPNSKYPQEKIAEINIILQQKENQRLYEAQIQQGNSNFALNNFETAKINFETALKYKLNDPIAIAKINQCNDAIEQRDYKAKLTQANKAFALKNYELAKQLYEEALQIKTDGTEAKNKIKECDVIVERIAIERKNEEFKSLIKQADKAFNDSQYDKAKALYQEALELLPNESYPALKIKIINEKLNEGSYAIDMNSIYEKCKGSVFYIMELGVNYWDEVNVKSQGSGFFITSDGIGLSNHHVLNRSNYKNSVVVLDKSNVFEIEKIIEQNDELDYVIFKVKLTDNKKVPYLNISNTLPKITNKVFAIGNPAGLSRRYSEGIVNGYEKDNTLIAIDLSITHGSSGGPLFNMKGEVVGITSGGHNLEGGNFNIAVNIQKLRLGRFVNLK